MFSQGARNLESCFNRSVKIMADLPLQTHRYLIQPVTEVTLLRDKLIKNYLGFIKKVRESNKYVLRQLYNMASRDVRTVTGRNLRNILLLTHESHVDELQPRMVQTLEYHKIDKEEEWRVGLVKEVIDIMHGEVTTPEGWTPEELSLILNTACTH